jgi:hypothetical protein
VHDKKEQPMTRTPKIRKLMVSSALLAGATLGAAGIASARTGSTGSTGSTATTPSSSGSTATSGPSGAAMGTPPAGAPDPATMTHGPNETLLTGTDLAKATAAAEAALPGATVVRAETDSSGDAAYEVHMKKADGTYATVELDSSFTVKSTITGFGAGPAGNRAPSGGTAPAGAPAAPAPSGTSTSTAA